MINIKTGRATHRQLHKIPLRRPPDAGCAWKGIQHGELIKLVLEHLEDKGLAPMAEEYRFYHVSRGGADLTASICVTPEDGEKMYTTLPCFGIQHSNAKRRSLSVFMGNYNPKTKTGMVLARIGEPSKVKIHMDLDLIIADFVKNWKLYVRDVYPVQAVTLREQKVYLQDLDTVLCKAGRAGIMPWSRLGMMDANFQKKNNHNAWTLIQSFCVQSGRNPAYKQLEQKWRFTQILEKHMWGKNRSMEPLPGPPSKKPTLAEV